MNDLALFGLKILAVSTGLSFLIKYGGRYLDLQPNNITASIIVLAPSLALGLFLGWQYNQD